MARAASANFHPPEELGNRIMNLLDQKGIVAETLPYLFTDRTNRFYWSHWAYWSNQS